MRKLEQADCMYAVQHGEFPDQIRNAGTKVAIVLTQSWCPQWLIMKAWLSGQETKSDCRIFYIEYDRESFFDEFMTFKEDHFNNRSVPYVRYYRAGTCIAESNFISRDGFEKKLAGV